MKLKTEGARALLAYWQRQKGDKRLPSTGDLDLVDLAPILSKMVIYEHETGDFQIRFFGTAMVRRLGVDLTGVKTSAFSHEPFGKLVIDHLCEVVTAPVMLTSIYNSQSNEGPLLEIEQIMLPWANEEGLAQCVLSHVSRTTGEDTTLTLKLEDSFKGLVDVQTVTL